MVTLFDTSVVAAYYMPERHSGPAITAVRNRRPRLISSLVRCELVSAFRRGVARGVLETQDMAELERRFADDLEQGHWELIPVSSDVLGDAAALLRTSPVPVRTLDAIHVASAVQRHADLVTADAQQYLIGVEAKLPAVHWCSNEPRPSRL